MELHDLAAVTHQLNHLFCNRPLVLRKTVFDGKIRRAVEADAKLGTEAGKVWDQVATAYKNWAPNERSYQILEADPAPGSNLVSHRPGP